MNNNFFYRKIIFTRLTKEYDIQQTTITNTVWKYLQTRIYIYICMYIYIKQTYISDRNI